MDNINNRTLFWRKNDMDCSKKNNTYALEKIVRQKCDHLLAEKIGRAKYVGTDSFVSIGKCLECDNYVVLEQYELFREMDTLQVYLKAIWNA
jgi:hypothetical protein